MPSVKRTKEANMRPLTAKLNTGMTKSRLGPSMSQPSIASPIKEAIEIPDFLNAGPSIESTSGFKLPAIARKNKAVIQSRMPSLQLPDHMASIRSGNEISPSKMSART